MEISDPWTRTIRLETHKLINFTFKLSNSYSKFILIMNTQEQQTQNIQSQEQKNRNPKYSKICTQILPQKSIVHNNQPISEWFFFSFLFYVLIKSRPRFGANPMAPFLPPQNQQHRFTPPTPTPKWHNPPPQPLVKQRHPDHETTPRPPRLVIVLINRVSTACGRKR